MASLMPTQLDSPAPTELDSHSPTELDIYDIILPLDSNAFDESLSSTAPLLVADDTVDIIEDSLPDDRMNGSVMPHLTETQEADLRRARAPPVRLWAVPDVLAMQPQPHTFLTSGDGMLAVAGAMRSIIAPPSSTISSNIVWILPNVGDDLFNHCCRIINDIQVVFYIGITGDPNRRWEEHNADQTVGPEPNMVMLIEAESSRVTAALEIQLLALYLSYMRCANRSSGGERASTDSPHYLYVLVASSPLLRRGH